MFKATLARRTSIVAATAGLVAATVLAASAVVGGAVGATENIRPICDNTYFNPPSTVGGTVIIPVHKFAADPDVTPVKLVSLFVTGSLGTARIVGNDVEFTLTSSTPADARIYWTFSDGSLTAQCTAYGSNEELPENG
jgi:hypothetical protein